ncbi:MAG: hypothetical protein ACE5FQ_07620 [Thiogranum sp.]
MTARNKLTAFVCTLAFATGAYAHPGHTHSQDFVERLSHAVQTEWLAPVLVVVVIGIAGYLYLKYSGNNR